MTDPNIVIREAQNERERQALFRLRHGIYVEELRFRFAVEHELRDEVDDDAILLLAVQNDEIIGTGRLVWGGQQTFTQHQRDMHDVDRFLSVVSSEEIAIFERLMVRSEFRGGPAPLLLFNALLDRALELGATVFLLDAQPHLVLLYERLGFRPYLAPAPSELGLAIPLAGLTQDTDYLASIGSPVAEYVASRIAPPDPARVGALRALFPARAPVRSEITNPDTFRAEVADLLEPLTHGLGVPSPALGDLLASSLVIDCPAEIPLILPGMRQQTLYLVGNGQVEVFEDGMQVGTSGPGSFTGEVAFLLSQPRMSEVRSGPEGATLIGFNVAALRDAFATSPAACAELYRALAIDLAHKLLERQVGLPRS
jgi:predicted GNAT family N-acyltransferase